MGILDCIQSFSDELKVDSDGMSIVNLNSLDQSVSTNYSVIEVDAMITDKLLDGYVLQTKVCPFCNTPLVKAADTSEGLGAVASVSSGESLKPAEPIQGVCFCVGCSAHVVTTKEENRILTELDILNGKSHGAILMAMSDEVEEVAEIAENEAYTKLETRDEDNDSDGYEKRCPSTDTTDLFNGMDNTGSNCTRNPTNNEKGKKKKKKSFLKRRKKMFLLFGGRMPPKEIKK